MDHLIPGEPEQPESLSSVVNNDDMLFDLIFDLLIQNKQPDVSNNITDNPKFFEVCQQINDLRELSSGLSRGDLARTVSSRGFIISNLKAVQANLRHLTWQSKRIAQGDYSQTVDFLGEISDAFNEMTRKLAEATQQLVHQANVDALTGVPNRLALNQFLASAFEQTVQEKGKLCVLIIDIDYFKQVNDTYGHLVGDEVLTSVAQRIYKQSRQSDYFARYGGEEFVMVLPETGLDTSGLVCRRILDSIRNMPIVTKEQHVIPVAVSIGASEYLPGDASYEDITRRADAALYLAKHGGRDSFHLFDPAKDPMHSPSGHVGEVRLAE